MQLSDDDKARIIQRSREAQNFMGSLLYQELSQWVKQEGDMAAQAIIYNKRDETNKEMSRSEFVEYMSAYGRALPLLTGVIKGFAGQEEQLVKMEKPDGSDKSTSTK